MPTSKPRVDAFALMGCKQKLTTFQEECCCAMMNSIAGTAIVSDQTAHHGLTLSFSAMACTCKPMADAARDALASNGLACASQLSGACCVCGVVHGYVRGDIDPTELRDGDRHFNDHFWLSD